jgi:4-aminobutyrate aminotransferase-like enzyme
MKKMLAEHIILGDARGKGCLMALELVKDRQTKEPFEEAGRMVYQKAFAKGLAWVPAGHILRLSPPLIMEDDMLMKGFDIIEEALSETEKHFGIG